jgi:hypothetical protein
VALPRLRPRDESRRHREADQACRAFHRMFGGGVEADQPAREPVEETREHDGEQHFGKRRQECDEGVAQGRARAELVAGALAGDFDAVVEARHDEQRQHRRDDGATDDRHGHRRIELATFTNTDRHGHHAGHQCERGHENRAQAHPSRMHECLFTIDALLFLGACAVEQQNGVLRHEAHEHDHADEAHEVQRAAGEIEREHHADQREQQRCHDGERRGERAELHHQHEIHHEDAHEQGDAHFGEQLVLIARRAAET